MVEDAIFTCFGKLGFEREGNTICRTAEGTQHVVRHDLIVKKVKITYLTVKIRTSNVRSPLELGSYRHETSRKRVSDDSQLSIFRRRKFFFDFFSKKIRVFRDFRLILEERVTFLRQNPLLHQILLQIHPS